MSNAGGDAEPDTNGGAHDHLDERERLSLRHGVQLGPEPPARDGEGEPGGRSRGQHQREQWGGVNLHIGIAMQLVNQRILLLIGSFEIGQVLH